VTATVSRGRTSEACELHQQGADTRVSLCYKSQPTVILVIDKRYVSLGRARVTSHHANDHSPETVGCSL